MKKSLSLMIALSTVMLILFAGCQPQTTPAPDQGDLSGTITVAGSTSVQPYSDLLKEAFEAKHSQVTVNVQGGGSTTGATSAINGAADIGALSRELKPAEVEQGLTPIVIAKDGIAVVINKDNSVEDLTIEQIAEIFRGTITNWKDVGGSDAAINAINREDGSGTRSAFHEIVVGKSNEFAPDLLTQGSTGAVRTAVQSDKNAIGYISLASLDDSVKALKVEGADATAENILNDSYKVARNFNYATKGEQSDLVKAFLEFVLSDEGQNIAKSMGLIAVK